MTTTDRLRQVDPGADTRSAAGRWPVAVAVLAVLVTFIPVTAVAVALTTIGERARVGTSSLQWITVAFVVPLAAVVMSAGVFGQRYGPRRVLLWGLWLSGGGGAVAAVSSALAPELSIRALWLGQGIAGIGAGLLLPTTLSLVADSEDRGQRDRHLSWWISSSLLGLAVGPLLAGVILQLGPYGWMFVPTSALSVALAVLAARTLPRAAAGARRSLDWTGQGAAITAIAATSSGVLELGRSGLAPTSVGLLSVGLMSFAGFIARERRTVEPLLDLSLLRVPVFAFAGAAAFGALFSGAGLLFLVSLFLGEVRQFSPLQIGGTLLFVTAVPAALNPAVAALLRRASPVPLLSVGLALASVGTLLMLDVDADTSIPDLGWRLTVFGVGFAALLTTVPAVVIDAVRSEQIAMATAVSMAIRQLGGALGPAVLGSVLVAAGRSGADPTRAFHAAVAVSGASLALLAAVGLVVGIRIAHQPNADQTNGGPR